MTNPIALLLGWTLDLIAGDPQRLPHPIVWFGRLIAFGEHHLNQGNHRRLKGGLMAIVLIVFVFCLTDLLRTIVSALSLFIPSPLIGAIPKVLFDAVIIFYCLAGTTLIREVRQVFLAVDRSLDEGRRQVARIVGRDTSALSAQEVRTAALETLAENLSDGVIAPLFWIALLGIPGMVAYKMVNTLDSMIGYRTDRYRDFGCWAAHIDDVANYIPARLTALLMLIVAPAPSTLDSRGSTPHLRGGFGGRLAFLRRYARCHASPNSGYPEAALAAILNCRFGGPHYYFGELFNKPFIGDNDRPLNTADMQTAIRVNRRAEAAMVILTALLLVGFDLFVYLCIRI
jgi:adenosylcobinamide-phosphate synthase